MRVLTVRQPWAWAIVHGGKDVENRVRPLGPYRGPVAIHVSKTPDRDSYADPNVEAAYQLWMSMWGPDPDGMRALDDWSWVDGLTAFGQVIGIVDLVDVHADCTEHVDGYGHTPTCSKWAMPDHYHLVLANPRPLPRPIPATGRLGLWRPDDALLAAISEQIEVSA
jgi:hypothetical protein